MSRTLRQARRRQKNWKVNSKRHSRCPVCRQSFADCPHSVDNVSRWLAAEVVRAEARAASKRAAVQSAAVQRADHQTPNHKTTREPVVGVVSDAQLRELLAAVRSSSDDMAHSWLRLAMEVVFDRACDDLRDVVAGRVVNVGGDLDIAKAVGDAVEEYHVRIKRT